MICPHRPAIIVHALFIRVKQLNRSNHSYIIHLTKD